MKLSTNPRRRLSVQISLGRAGRLHRLVMLLAQGSRRRDDLLRELGIGLRSFYRELELLKRLGIKVQNKDRGYSLGTSIEQAERQLPFTNPHLSFAEMADLSRFPGPASRRLAELLARVTRHSNPSEPPPMPSGRGRGRGQVRSQDKTARPIPKT